MWRERVNPYAPVGWIRAELDDLLGQVSNALEVSADNRDTGLLAPLLDQLAGILEILNTRGGLVAIRELEECWKAFRRGAVDDKDQALSAMMQASVVLGLYLDRLESGQKDHPLLLLPALNDLRAARGLQLLSESSLFEPDLNVELPPEIAKVGKTLSGRKQKKTFTELGESFGDWIGHWEDDETNMFALTKMEEIAHQLRSQLKQAAHRRTWWIAEAVIRGVHHSVIENSITLRHLFKRLQALMLAMAQRPGDNETATENDAMAKAMLYQLATAATGEPLVDEIKACYQLADQVPENLAMDKSRGHLGGQSRELFDSLGAAIKTEIDVLKEQLSEAMEDEEMPSSEPRPVNEALTQISATLDMLNLSDAGESLRSQVPVWEKAVRDQQLPAESDMNQLAEHLIRIESTLEEYVSNLGSRVTSADGEGPIGLTPFMQSTFRQVMNESVGSMQVIKDGLRDWMGNAASTDQIIENNALFVHIYGALLLTGHETVAEATHRLHGFTEKLLAHGQEFNQALLEPFADAIATLELYLASQRDLQIDNIHMLESILLQRLDSIEELDSLEAAQQEGTAESADTGADDDDNFLEIFLEEFDVVYPQLLENVTGWFAKPSDTALLPEIRRGYHTLKGSGLMVGADEIGEFSWQIENLLNHTLEGKQEHGSDCRHIVRLATAALPLLRERLEGQKDALDPVAIEMINNAGARLADGIACNFETLAEALPDDLASLLPIAQPDHADELEEEPEPSVDPALVALIGTEVSKHVATLKSLYDKLESGEYTAATNAHILAAHTISGAFAQAPVHDEVEVMAALEHLFGSHKDSKIELTQSLTPALSRILGMVEVRLEMLTSSDTESSLDTHDLAGLLRSLQDELKFTSEPEPEPELEPEPEQEAEPVDELVTFFLQEGREILERCDTLLNQWRDAPTELSVVSGLQREIHTFKGSARMVGLEAMGSLSHAMESTLEKIAEGQVSANSKLVESLEQGSDYLLGMLETVQSGGEQLAAGVIDKYISSLKAAEQPAQAEIVPEPVEEQAKPVEPAKKKVAAKKKAPARKKAASKKTAVRKKAAAKPAARVRKSAILDSTPAFKPIEIPDIPEIQQAIREMPDAADSKDAGQETIRVSSELLDNLVNYAGEISIFRSRVEQQMSTTQTNLKEIHQTIARLREQLRKMDLETENQILSGHRRDSRQNEEDFDPLELDRYSTIQQLSRGLAESVSDLVSLEGMLGDTARQSEALLQQQSRVNNELQEGLMQSRMVPFATLAPRLRRVVRKAGTDTSKKAKLTLQLAGGSDGQLDRNILERITAPLEHMLRNAIAHGIESPAERRKKKKPANGVIAITVENEATELVIRIEDDGAGIDLNVIRDIAIERGLMQKREKLTEAQILNFLLVSGFSTASEVTSLAGRGVGMDVVSNEIKQIGGSLSIKTAKGKGSTFTVRIPFSLAIMQAMSALVGDRKFAIPLVNVRGVAKMAVSEYQKQIKVRKPVYEFAGEKFPLLELEPQLGHVSPPLGDEPVSLLMIKAGDQLAAFRVTELYEHSELVVKAVGPQINSIPGILGGTITGDGQVMLILDMGPLIQRAIAEGILPRSGKQKTAVAAAIEATRLPLIMVVDDSITMRKVTSRVLENSNFEVITAKDGLDAVEQLKERTPDLMLLDIEMPRMDGFELAGYVRSTHHLLHIPLIMITSRSGKKHRDHAAELGVDGYLTKPYQEAELVRSVKELLVE